MRLKPKPVLHFNREKKASVASIIFHIIVSETNATFSYQTNIFYYTDSNSFYFCHVQAIKRIKKERTRDNPIHFGY